jgi:non-ribosomal peptide synthase protein (TIGR01720 family)
MDGVSWRILLEDFYTGYIQSLKSEDVLLPLKTDSFKTWSESLNRYAAEMPVKNGREFRRQLEYWKGVETADAAPLPRGRDVPPEKRKIKYARTVSLELTEAETETLLKNVNHAYNTEINDILLTSLGLALREWTGGPGTLIHLEGHGRESLVEGIDIGRTVGWFTSQFPFLLDTGEKGQMPGPLIRVKDALRQVPYRGAGYGIFKYLVSPRHMDGIAFHREPEVCFNYLGQFLQETRHGDAVFEASTQKTGDPLSPESEMIYPLDVRGLVVGGRLKLSFVYDYRYTVEEIEALRDRCKGHLSAIIDHCTGKEGTQRTVGDFSAGDLDDEEMEDIFDELED